VDTHTFLARHLDVSSARHGNECIYVGRDDAMIWWLLRGEKVDQIGADTAEEAQAAAHQLVDGDENCALKLDWELIPQAKP
jgi:hypothetical protein